MTVRVRPLCSSDFPALRRLEADVFGAAGEDVLCPHYLRLCTEMFDDTCFMALVDDKPAGYLLCFVRDRDAYCTTLAIREEFQRTRVTPQLLAAFVQNIIEKVDVCWFTVKPDNLAARQRHRMLGASDVGRFDDFYGPGDERIVSKMDRQGFERLRLEYERLGLLSQTRRSRRAGRRDRRGSDSSLAWCNEATFVPLCQDITAHLTAYLAWELIANAAVRRAHSTRAA